MEIGFFLLAMAVNGLTVVVAQHFMSRAKRRRIRSWSEAARAAGLEEVVAETGRWSTGVLTARAGPHRVRLEDLRPALHMTPGEGIRQRIRLTIEGDSGITLRPEERVLAHERYVGPPETEIGDSAFDREVSVHGPVDCLRAVLDDETRRRVRPLIQGRIAARGAKGSSLWADVVIRDGDIVASFREAETEELEDNLPAVLATLMDVANRLQRPASVVARLIENTRDEPEWRVRRENVLLLARQYPRHPATPSALVDACGDAQAEVRLEAALALGPERAEDTLLEIASDEGASESLCGRAIAALGLRLPEERAKAILDHALRARRHETAGACLALLGQRGGPAVVEPLAKVLSLVSGPLAVMAARALGASRAPSAEVPLLRALQDDASDVCVAAAQALGEVGSASAVLPLKEAGERNARHAPLQKAAREAVAAIQSRLGGATPGQLSLAEADTGRLSLADEDPHGRVSLAESAASKLT